MCTSLISTASFFMVIDDEIIENMKLIVQPVDHDLEKRRTIFRGKTANLRFSKTRVEMQRRAQRGHKVLDISWSDMQFR